MYALGKLYSLWELAIAGFGTVGSGMAVKHSALCVTSLRSLRLNKQKQKP